SSVSEGKISLEGGGELEFSALAWAAGIRPPEPVRRLSPRYRRGRFLAVDEFLRVPSAPGPTGPGTASTWRSGGGGPPRWQRRLSSRGGGPRRTP
ncbi:MAG: hypothetical protein DRO06_01070, partial [Thermoproteota archaeon]